MGKSTAAAVNRGDNGVVGGAGFYRRVCLRVSHLSHADHVGVETECRHDQILLGHVVGSVIRGAGEGVHHVVDDPSLLVALNEGQLAGTRLDGVDTLVVGDGTQQGVQKCGLTRAGTSRHHEGNTVAKAGLQKGQHILGDGLTVKQVGAIHSCGMEHTDGYRDASVGIHDGFLECGDSGVVGKMPLRDGGGVVDDHARMVEELLDHVDCVLGREEMLLGLLDPSVQMGECHVVPTVDVDLLQVRIGKVLGENGVFRHFGKQAFHQALGIEARYRVARIIQEFTDIRLQLCGLAPVDEGSCVVLGNMALGEVYKGRKFDLCHTLHHPFIFLFSVHRSHHLFCDCLNGLHKLLILHRLIQAPFHILLDEG